MAAGRCGVKTRTPDETEQALYRVADRRWWADINLYLVGPDDRYEKFAREVA